MKTNTHHLKKIITMMIIKKAHSCSTNTGEHKYKLPQCRGVRGAELPVCRPPRSRMHKSGFQSPGEAAPVYSVHVKACMVACEEIFKDMHTCNTPVSGVMLHFCLGLRIRCKLCHRAPQRPPPPLPPPPPPTPDLSQNKSWTAAQSAGGWWELPAGGLNLKV